MQILKTSESLNVNLKIWYSISEIELSYSVKTTYLIDYAGYY